VVFRVAALARDELHARHQQRDMRRHCLDDAGGVDRASRPTSVADRRRMRNCAAPAAGWPRQSLLGGRRRACASRPRTRVVGRGHRPTRRASRGAPTAELIVERTALPQIVVEARPLPQLVTNG
jgi:hypothetical protein